MKLAILHLSDLHFREDPEKNPILTRTGNIAAAVRSLSEPNLDACFVAVTGDVAFSGRSTEYEQALDFFVKLRTDLDEFDVSSDRFIFIPGNHDCNLKQPNSIRDAIIRDTIRSKNGLAGVDSSMADKCLEVQTEFAEFMSLFSNNSQNSTSNIFSSFEYLLDNTKIRFHCYNTAWMSEIHEKQGQLYFPMHLLAPLETHSADLVVTLLHHPFRWFESDNSRTFSNLVEESTDLILSGHEHTQDRYQKITFDGRTSHFLEGSLMQGAIDSDSGFAAVLIDLSTLRQQNAEWSWSGSAYRLKREPHWRSFERRRRSSSISNTPYFSRYLHDMGTPFTHPRKENIALEDLFVYPDLNCLASRAVRSKKTTDSEEVTSSSTLIEDPVSRALVIGPDGSGKSTLAKVLYLGFLSNGLKPLLLRGERLGRGYNSESLKRVMNAAINEQYGADSSENYLQLPLDKKIVIIDDIQASNINSAGHTSLIRHLRDRFASLVVFAHDSFFVSRLTQSKHEANDFMGFSIFSLREMGNRLRGTLIDRWTELGQDHTNDAREEALEVEALERKIRTLLGRNLMPSYPIFVLAILQTYESQKALNTASGSYGYYYEALITAALHNQRSKIPHDTVYTFLSLVAYTMFTEKISKLSASQFSKMISTYRTRHQVGLDESQICRVLQRARIVVWDESGYGEFQYPYVYYYFVARYLADNIYRENHTSSIRELITRLVGSLHVEENANIVIFFLYLTKDEISITSLVERAVSLYSEAAPCNFRSHVEFTSQLTTVRPQMVLEDGDVKAHKDEHRQQLDESDATKNADDEDQLEGVIRLNEAFKTLQIMGQVLRNFPGSLEGGTKITIAKESYLLGLRVLGFVFHMVESNLTEFRSIFRSIVEQDERSDEIDLDSAVDFAIYRIMEVIGFGMIKKISHCVGSEYLQETLEEVSDDSVPLSISLISLSMKLDHFIQFPKDEIVDVYDDVHSDIFTGSIVRRLVIQHLYLFPVSQALRQEVCDQLDIKILDPKLITGEDRK